MPKLIDETTPEWEAMSWRQRYYYALNALADATRAEVASRRRERLIIALLFALLTTCVSAMFVVGSHVATSKPTPRPAQYECWQTAEPIGVGECDGSLGHD